MSFLLLLFILFIVVPVVRIAFAIYKARRNARRIFDRFRQSTSQQTDRRGFRQETRPTPKRKKINPNDGEFVSYEDIPADNSPQTSSEQIRFEVEQQIVDAEWEDIK